MEFDVQQQWDQFKLSATKIDDFLETRLKLPEKPGSDVTGSLYMNGYVYFEYFV